MRKGKEYIIVKNKTDVSVIGDFVKHFRAVRRFLSHARASLLRLILIYSIITTVLLGLLLFYIWDAYEVSYQQKTVLEASLSYWENIIDTHPNFPDAYFNASLYAFRLENKEKAYIYIEKALILDPLFTEAKKLRTDILEK